MKVIVSGASGLVGSVLAPFLTTAGHEVVRLVRGQPTGKGVVRWDPEGETIDTAAMEGCDAVVHLAGESIAVGRWTAAKKARIRDSRVNGTRIVAKAVSSLTNPSKTLVCASAIGFYGDRGDEILREDSPPGKNFLAGVCQKWESAAQSAADRGVRVVNLRFGVILSSRGGALAKMLTPFKMGVGGVIGNGKQYMSWITLDDVISVISHVLASDDLRGPVNTVTPNPVTNATFTQILGRVLKRPTVFPMPAFAAKLAFGEMADELLLASARVEPAKLKDNGYVFRDRELEPALRRLLGK